MPRIVFHDPVSFDGLLRLSAEVAHVVVGDQDGPPLARPPKSDDVMVIVGPEGGLAEAEVTWLRAQGASFATISTHRLRAETAAACLVAAVQRD